MPNVTIPPPVPPPFLIQLPKSLVRAIDATEVFSEALLCVNHTAIYGPIIAQSSIDSYFAAARRQQQRIERARRSVQRRLSNSRRVLSRTSLFHEIHFYLISWTRVAQLAEFIRDRVGSAYRRTGLVYRRFYYTDLRLRIDARDHLEHFEDRLPGGKEQSKLGIPSDLLNVSNEFLTFRGTRVDIGPASLKILKMFRDEFADAILFDSCEVLEGDADRLARVLKRAASRLTVPRARRHAQRLLRQNRHNQDGSECG